MAEALVEARRAEAMGEVPVGAVLVRDGAVLARGCNQPISSTDPTAHAEIVALRRGAAAVGNYRLPGAELFVTVEPCLMCAGALIHARVSRVVYGAAEPRAGAVTSNARLFDAGGINHRPQVTGGVLEVECAALLKGFFAARRG